MIQSRVVFGKVLRLRRRELQMSQEELARAAGISRQSLANYERGIGNPKLDHIMALLRVLMGVLRINFVDVNGRGEDTHLESEYEDHTHIEEGQ